MTREDGKSRDAEMRGNEFNRNPAGTGTQRDQPADSSGISSSRSRNNNGAERRESTSSGRGGAGAPSGTSSSNAAEHYKPGS